MDVDLPVWTIRPNWKNGVLERLEWLTDVLASESGVEQRRSVRLSPRRSFEITVNPTHADRTYLDLVLHRLGSEEWLIPLWHDQGVLTQSAVVGAQALMFDNTFREHRDGDYAILYRDTRTWEVVEVQTAWDGGLILAGDVEREWPRGTKVYPLRKALIQTDTSLKALTSRVGESVLLFQINEANDYPEGYGDEMVMYQSSPLLTRAPNRVTEITTDHTRLFDQADGEIGLIHRTDSAGRAFAVQSHNWQVTGREAQAGFRSFLYTLRGRQRMVWLPTFNDDVTLTRPRLAGVTQAYIQDVGMRYIGSGSPIPGRATLWTGSEVVRIGTLPAPLVLQEERLGLLAPLTASYAAGASWGFLQAARLDQDSIEIHHYADSEGTFEVAAGFKTFANDRDAAGSNFNPIPVSAKSSEPCGVPMGLNPCNSIVDWTYRITLTATGESDLTGTGFWAGPGLQYQVFELNHEVPGIYKATGTADHQVITLYQEDLHAGNWNTLQYGKYTSNGNWHVTITMQKRGESPETVVSEDKYQGYGNHQFGWVFH